MEKEGRESALSKEEALFSKGNSKTSPPSRSPGAFGRIVYQRISFAAAPSFFLQEKKEVKPMHNIISPCTLSLALCLRLRLQLPVAGRPKHGRSTEAAAAATFSFRKARPTLLSKLQEDEDGGI